MKFEDKAKKIVENECKIIF